MSSTPVRRIPVVTNAARALLAETYLTIVSPTWPWGYLRLAGLALMAEGLFLMLVSVSVPVGGLALLSLLVGEGAFVASFAGGVRPRVVSRRASAPSPGASPAPRAAPGETDRVCRVERSRPRCRRSGRKIG